MAKLRCEAIASIKNMMVASIRPRPAQFRRTLPQPLGHIILQVKAINLLETWQPHQLQKSVSFDVNIMASVQLMPASGSDPRVLEAFKTPSFR